MMRFLIIIFFSIVGFLPTDLEMEATSGSEEKMTWNQERPLQWSDFKGKPKPALGFVASTNSGISFSYSYKITNGQRSTQFEVSSFFYPLESWYLQGEVNAYILKHEQTHFDISELHARKLKKRLEAAHFSDELKKEVETIYHDIEQKRKAMQDAFDLESDHSKNEEGEEQWEVYVAQQLQIYDRWK